MGKRDSRLNLSIWLNLFTKTLNMGVNFLLVPVLIAFLGKEKYGIWVTIYAFVNWFNIFDLGLGQGLKLKLTEAFTLKRNKEIRTLISSTYFFVMSIALGLFVIAIISYIFFNWSFILSINERYHLEANQALLILTLFFLLVFVAKLIGEVYASLQLPFIENIVKTIGQLFFLVFIVILSYNSFSQGSLLVVSIFSILPLFVLYLGINIYFFGYKSISLSPRLNLVSKKSLRQVVNPGISFFTIQIGCIILYSTDNLIIINLLSSEAVADYNVYYKYYSIPFLFYNIYVGSHWSSFIDALSKNDKRWIQKKMKMFNRLFILLCLSYVFVFLVNEKIISLWVGNDKIEKNDELGLFLILYFLVSALTTNYIYVINAFGKLRIQLIAYIIIAILNIPLSIVLVDYFKMGSAGVIIASTICLTILTILMPIQYHKIIKGRIKGIWNL